MTSDRYNVLVEMLQEKRMIVDTDKGIVYSLRGEVSGSLTRKGYLRLTRVRFKGKSYNFCIHEIVAVAGGLNPSNLTINHKDGNKKHNWLSNLEVLTSEENIRHGHNNGLYTYYDRGLYGMRR